MRLKSVLMFTSLWMLTACAAQAEEAFYLSQVANGASGGSSFRTTFVLFNNTDTEVRALLKLTGDDGKPLVVTLDGLGTKSEFTIVIGAGATQILQTDGVGALVAGAATVTAPARIGVSAIFGIYDSSGGFVTEAGVGSSALMTEFVLPVDATGLFNTGLALFNGGASSARLSLILRGTDGKQFDQTTLDLDAGRHVARFVAGQGQLFPGAGGFRGTLLVRSTAPVAALGLRQNERPLSYTSLPVVPLSANKPSQNLAQVVDGSFGTGGFKTSFLLFNLSSGTASASVTLTRDDGTPLVVNIPGTGTGSRFDVALPAGGAAFLQTDGQGALSAGAASIASDAPIGASAIFSVFDAQGRFQTEAGVGDSPVLTALTLPVEVKSGSDTGVAFFNPSNSTATLTLKLMDAAGALLDSGTAISLGPGGHTARFVSQIFPGIANYQGSLSVTTSAGVAALTLRENRSPLSYTTLPVASGVAVGKAPPAPLLTKTREGVAATADVTIDETLSYGFRLSGHIEGAVQTLQVQARRSDGKVFDGAIDPDSARYLVAVDSGTYTVVVSYKLLEVPGGAALTLTYTDPVPVRVEADITRNLTLPLPRTYAVSGRASGLSSLPDATGAVVVFTSGDRLTEGVFPLMLDGTYGAVLPNGDYRIGIRVPLVSFTPFQSQSLELYSLGLVGVNGAPATANVSVPATAKVSGAVRAPWLGSFSGGLRVAGYDLTAPLFSAADVIRPLALSVANADPSGPYQAVLARDRSYALTASAPVTDGRRSLGIMSYPVAPEPLNLSGDTTRSFNLPDIPARVTISGRVRDSQGKGVGEVLVTAVTEAVTGAAGAGFAANTISDTQGNYSLVVLSGTNYQLQFLPRAPDSGAATVADFAVQANVVRPGTSPERP